MVAMSSQIVVVLVLLVAAIAMFAMNKPRMDAVGLIMLTLLPFTGAVTMAEALSGFSDPNIVLIAALFVIGDGLVRTGVARRPGDWLTAKAGSSDLKLLVPLMLVVGGLGSMMSSTAVTAIFIPVALRIAHSTGTSPSRLMMPLSFAALISGMTTLVATAPNLVVNSELIRSTNGEKSFQFFSFTPFGVPILVLGIIYMSFARRWLSSAKQSDAAGSQVPTLRDWIRDYKLAGREHRVRVTERSMLVGKTLGELQLRDAVSASLVAIERGPKLVQPTAKTELRAGDILLVDVFADPVAIEEVRAQLEVELMPLAGPYFTDRSQEIGMVKVILPATSELIGKTATAVLMAPIALAIAKDLHASPYPFAMTVALAASTAFMTPVSSPVNTLVVTPGNYTFGDFLKVGVPFSLIVMVVCVIMVPLILPL